jgi:large subunit ribosomal protein L13e
VFWIVDVPFMIYSLMLAFYVIQVITINKSVSRWCKKYLITFCFSCVIYRFNMVKHNNQLHGEHFRKHWQERVRVNFDQPAAKKRRRLARKEKAAKLAPRPAAGALRPVVRGQTVRYNLKVRVGRGFSLAELKAAGVSPKKAATIGISVDHRRTNKSTQSLNANVERLKAYLSKLVVFPRKAKHPKKGDASAAELANVKQHVGAVLPISAAPVAAATLVSVTDELKNKQSYKALRQERTNAKLVGIREKKRKEAEAEKPKEKEEGAAE